MLHRNNVDKLETEVRRLNAENMKCFKSELGKVDWETYAPKETQINRINVSLISFILSMISVFRNLKKY